MARASDAFPVLPTSVASAVGLAMGVGLVAWLGVRPVNTTESAAPEVEAEPPPRPTEVEVRPARVEAPEAPEPDHVAGAPHDGAQTPAPPTTPFGPAATGRVAIAPGRVAYIRCDGLGEHCPRDAAMEQAVWAVVQTLPRCADPPRELGASDLRLDLHGEAPTDVHARDVPGAPAIDTHKLLACIAGPLSHVRTTMHASRVVVSFRFTTSADD